MIHRYPRLIALSICLALLSPPASANMMLPTVFFTLFGMAIALVPVVVIEAWVLVQRLDVAAWTAGLASTVANLASTIVGIPLAWIAMLLVCLFARAAVKPDMGKLGGRFLDAVVSAPVFPGGDTRYNSWMLPLGCLFLMLPYFIASCVIESTVTGWIITSGDSIAVGDAVIRGNAFTYGLLGAIVAYFTAWEFLRIEFPFRYQQVHTVAMKLRRWIHGNATNRAGYFYLTLATLYLLPKGLVLALLLSPKGLVFALRGLRDVLFPFRPRGGKAIEPAQRVNRADHVRQSAPVATDQPNGLPGAAAPSVEDDADDSANRRKAA